jgi:two-component system, response regulator PdtaR
MGCKGVVLVVEDEAIIRMNIVQVAEDLGYEILEAANADEAIQILESHDEIRVVFTDVGMPGSMDGLKLARAISGRWPPIQLIVTSGRDVSKLPDFPTYGRFIVKPYRNAQVASALRDALNA